MAEGQFNVIAWARRMGLKNLSDLPFTPSVQPVAIVGDHADLTPAYMAPQAIFSGLSLSGIGFTAKVQIASLDPGGCFVKVYFSGAFTNGTAKTVLGRFITTVDEAPVMQISNELPLVEVQQGANAPTGVNGFQLIGNPDIGRPLGPWYIPRGLKFLIEATGLNQAFEWAVDVRGVPATEHGPS